MGFMQYIADWINKNPGRAAGAFAGFLISILLFTLGIGKTLLVILFVAIGYLIGKSRDENVSLLDQIAGIFKRK